MTKWPPLETIVRKAFDDFGNGFRARRREADMEFRGLLSGSVLLASWLGPLRRFVLAHLKALRVKRIEFCSAGA
jgi:hypothetical protein